MKAALYDFRGERRISFYETLKRDAKWVCDHWSEVYATDTEEMDLHQPGDYDLVMLHLRGPDNKQSTCGNDSSWEFLTSKLAAMPNMCLIAYTGGSVSECPEPKEFAKYRETNKWWVYFNGVKGPEDINLKEFAKAWSAAPDAGPPLRLLRPPPEIGALKLLILGYQAAHGCGNTNAIIHLGQDSLTEARYWTENMDWWRPILGKDLHARELILALGYPDLDALDQKIENSDMQSLDGLGKELIVHKLAKFYSNPDNVNAKIPEDLSQSLLDFQLGSKCAA